MRVGITSVAAAALVYHIDDVSGFVFPHLERCGSHPRSFVAMLASFFDDDDDAKQRAVSNMIDPSRRSALISTLPLSLVATMFSSPPPARASLVQFPCRPGVLKNRYTLMRAGQSLLEDEGIWGSNPLFLTNRENALSEIGIRQVRLACEDMLRADYSPSAVLHPLAANAIDTANIVTTELKLGRNRVLPEYTNLDARGLGLFDMNDRSVIEPAIYAMDVAEAGPDGRGALPPPNEDGTPNETLFNQFTRLRQLLSVCETNYSGDEVLLIFPDATGPALLSCLVAGIPVSRVHELDYLPGEVRFDISMERTLMKLRSGPSEQYLETLRKGKDQLVALRENPERIVSVSERKDMDEARLEEERQKKVSVEREKREREERERKATVLAAVEKEQAAAKERKASDLTERRKAVAVAAANKAKVLAEKRKAAQLASRNSSVTAFSTADTKGLGGSQLISLGLAFSVVAWRSTQPSFVEEVDVPKKHTKKVSPPQTLHEVTPMEALVDLTGIEHAPGLGPEHMPQNLKTKDAAEDRTGLAAKEMQDLQDNIRDAPINIPEISQTEETEEGLIGLAEGKTQDLEDRVNKAPANNPDTEEVEEDRRVLAEEEMHDLEDRIREAPFNIPDVPQTEEDRLALAKEAMESYMNKDDGGEAWIASLSNLMDEQA